MTINPAPLLGPIPVLSFQLGATNDLKAGSRSSGAESVKVQFDELDVTVPLGDYSPALFQSLTTGGHNLSVTLTESMLSQVGLNKGLRQVVASWTMTTVFVVADQIKGDVSQAGRPIEELHFAYGAIKESVGGNSATWSVVNNNSIF
jgi:hypothetical protein